MTRERTQRLFSTLLNTSDGRVRCPRILTAGLEFGDADPVETMMVLLAKLGFSSPEEARVGMDLPAEMRLCRAGNKVKRLDAHQGPPTEVLRQAILLGMCTPVFFDPERPVIWTTNSLIRAVEVYDMEAFYE